MSTRQKVALIGTGMVGMSFAYAAISQGIFTELVLIDVDKERAQGEAHDLLHAVPFFHTNVTIYAGDYSDCVDADVVVIPAGAPQLPGETRLDLVAKNSAIMESIISQLMESGFDGIILVASNPVDIMTYVALKKSKLPPQRVFGSGTVLDSGRLRHALGQKLGVAAKSIHAYIIGEHGDSSLATFSAANVGGQLLTSYIEEKKLTQKDLDDAYTYARDAAYAIIKKKRATYYGIGAALAMIVRAILHNERVVLPISVYLEGQYGQKDICTGVPSVVGRNGVEGIIEIHLSPKEKEEFDASCAIIRQVISTLKP